jgi:hypothetical protein
MISAIEWNGHTGRVGGAVAGALDPAVVGGEAGNDSGGSFFDQVMDAVASGRPDAHTSSPDGTVRFYPNMVLFPWLNGEGDAA